jgi:hypothetical protein
MENRSLVVLGADDGGSTMTITITTTQHYDGVPN